MLIYNIYIIYIITYTWRLLCLTRSRVPSLGFSQGSFASAWLKSSSSAASHSDQLSKNRNIEAQIQENVGQIINASSKEQEYKNYVYYIYISLFLFLGYVCAHTCKKRVCLCDFDKSKMPSPHLQLEHPHLCAF